MMSNTQLSSSHSSAYRHTRSGWQRTPDRAPSRTLNLLSQLRRAQPTYLGLAGALIALVGLLTAAGWFFVGIGVAPMIAAGLATAARPRTKVMYWRGRRIELTDEPSTRSGLRRWLGRRRSTAGTVPSYRSVVRRRTRRIRNPRH
jgi:ferric-dicitrate binding protein FerR (iron transport regulator)